MEPCKCKDCICKTKEECKSSCGANNQCDCCK